MAAPHYPQQKQAQGHGQKLPPHIPQISPEAVLIGRIVLLLIILLVVVLVVRAILKHWRVDEDEEGEEEDREALPVQEILKMRREERRKKKKDAVPALETLAPDSARARYRELLQTVAVSDEKLTRRSSETPTEYEARLMSRIGHTSANPEQTPPDATILNELTQAYARERYGGKNTDATQKNYLNTWVPHLLQRFKNLTGNTNMNHP